MRHALRTSLRLLPWLLLLAGLAGSGWWRYYLAPRHMPFLWAGLGVLVWVLLASELDGQLGRTRSRRARLLAALHTGQSIGAAVPRRAPATIADWLETGVHWLPLFLLLVLGPTTLTLHHSGNGSRSLRLHGPARTQAGSPGQTPPAEPVKHYYVVPSPVQAGPAVSPAPPAPARKPRSTRMPKKAPAALPAAKTKPTMARTVTAKPASPPAAQPSPARAQATPDPKPSAAQAQVAASPKDRAAAAAPRNEARQYNATDLVKLFTGHGGGKGAAVEVIGRLHRVKGDDQIVPVGVDPAKYEVVIYRYAIWCCVADAVPATAVLQGAKAGKIKDDAWVKLRGTLHYTGPEHDIPQLQVASMEEIPTPDDPYLYVQPGEL